MRRLNGAGLIVLLLGWWAGGLAAQETPPVRSGTALVQGIVVADDTGEPLSDVSVELYSAADSSRVAAAITNAEGAFRFQQLREGVYYVRLLSVGYAANATAAGIELSELRVELEGDLDLHTFLGLSGDHAGYTDIRARVHLVADATDEQLAELHRKVTSTSPVGHTLNRAIPVSIELA